MYDLHQKAGFIKETFLSYITFQKTTDRISLLSMAYFDTTVVLLGSVLKFGWAILCSIP